MENNIKNTDVNIRVELAKGKIQTKNMMNIKIGDIIPLETSPSEQAIVRIEEIPKYKGIVGHYKGNKAIKIMKPILPIDNEELQ